MCGILAIVGPAPPPIQDFDAARDLLSHRGPDDCGTWSADNVMLGSRRLAIIDIGPGGHQPMVDPQTGVALVFNGEIYNYIELREELAAAGHKFATQSDTEVLLRAYLQWGHDLTGRLNGMWAFVVWDPRNREAFFSRDRFGEKPFYYALVDGSLIAASEPKAILALQPQLRRVDEIALYDLLASGLVCHDDRSFYAGIKLLEPGCSGSFRPGDAALRLARYWDLPRTGEPLSDAGAALDRFQEVFEDAVRLRLRSDVPVGITLSGGLDSTSVLHAAQHELNRSDGGLTAFTSVYRPRADEPRIDEREWAQRAVQPYPRVYLKEVEASPDEWLGVLRRITWHMDGPDYSPAVFPLWTITRTARAHDVPVLLEGQGGDELLAGYGHYTAPTVVYELRAAARDPSRARLRALADAAATGRRSMSTRRLVFELAAEAVPGLRALYWRRFGALGTLRPEYVANVREIDAARPGRTVAGEHRGLEARLARDFLRDMLPGFLHYGDSMSMAHSVENRLPFLDHRLVELCFGLASSLKLGGGENKRVLRAYLRRAGQATIANRTDKRGYPTPADRWLAADGGALPRELLLAPDSRITRFASPSRIRRLITHNINGRAEAGNHLYRLLTTELWLRDCIDA